MPAGNGPADAPLRIANPDGGARGFGRIVNITSSAVKAPIEALGLSIGARSELTGFVAGLARRTVRHNVTINNLLPGPFATDRMKALTEAAAQAGGKAFEETWSAQAGYITGRNVLIDGGAYSGTFWRLVEGIRIGTGNRNNAEPGVRSGPLFRGRSRREGFARNVTVPAGGGRIS